MGAIRMFGAVALGVGLLTLSSYLSVPMYPVPMTMQTLAVTLLGVLYGPRLGAATVAAWLATAAVGVPVLTEGACGLAPFLGTTAGYLFVFPAAAAVSGWVAKSHGLVLAFLALVLGNALCLIGGAAWLTVLVGPEAAVSIGVVPFLAGGLVKSAIGAVTLKLMKRA